MKYVSLLAFASVLLFSSAVYAGGSFEYGTVTRVEPVYRAFHSQPICHEVYEPGRHVYHNPRSSSSVYFSGTFHTGSSSIRFGASSRDRSYRSYSRPRTRVVCNSVPAGRVIEHYRVWYIDSYGHQGMTHTDHYPGPHVLIRKFR